MEQRKLNMEEKRKLEKVMFSDIDNAISELQCKERTVEENMVEEMQKKPIAEAKKLFATYQKAERDSKVAKKQLRKLGYEVSYRHNYDYDYDEDEGKEGNYLGVRDSHPDIKKAVDAIQSKIDKVERLKRDFSVKLFASQGEAPQLLEELSKQLAEILK